MNRATITFLEAQRDSANYPLGSHQARSRGLAIQVAKGDPELAGVIANDIEEDLPTASDVSGFHPDSCRRLAAWLRDWRKAL